MHNICKPVCILVEKQISWDRNLPPIPLMTLQLLYKQDEIETKSGNLFFVNVKVMSSCFHSFFFINSFTLPESDKYSQIHHFISVFPSDLK